MCFPNEVIDADLGGIKDALNRMEKVVFVYYGNHPNGETTSCSGLFLRLSSVCLQVVAPGKKEIVSAKEMRIKARKSRRPIITITIEEFIKLDEEQLYLLFDDVEKRGLPVLLVCLLSVLACSLICYLGIKWSYSWIDGIPTPKGLDSISKRGLFGDSWGGVNAIVSAFAFAGVIVTLFLQNRDLNLQRKEMARQREEFEKENKTLKYQRFENLFYNMLNLQQRIVDGLRIECDDEEIHRDVVGRDVFKYAFEDEEFTVITQGGKKIKVNGYRNVLKYNGIINYNGFWEPAAFDHYFTHLYKILQFVDSQPFSHEEAYRYVTFLRGTLSRYELVWIYYDALQPKNNKMKKLIERYSLLNNLRTSLLSLTPEASSFFKEHGLSVDELKKRDFSGKDFEYYLTSDRNESTKYYLTAFLKESREEIALALLARWRSFLEQKSNNLSGEGTQKNK